VLTVPNVITLVRLSMIPVFLWLLFGLDNRVAAAALLAVLGATDWVDGWYARRYGQVTELGKVLDPTADRILFIVCVGGIIIADGAPIVFSVLVVAREVVVGGAMALLVLRGMKAPPVQWIGKLATALLMVAFPCFLGGSADFQGHEIFTAAGWIFGIPGLIISYYAAIKYVPIMRQAWAQRHERAAT
jgi:cardiolipin synthase